MSSDVRFCPNCGQNLCGLGDCATCGYAGPGVPEDQLEVEIDANEETGHYERRRVQRKDAMNTIDSAHAATNSVQASARQAAKVLQNGWDGRIMVNGYGIFADPRARATDLRIAREHIDKALALMEATTWPTDADYVDAERATRQE
jgi:hypothetical protein